MINMSLSLEHLLVGDANGAAWIDVAVPQQRLQLMAPLSVAVRPRVEFRLECVSQSAAGTLIN